MSRKSNWDKGYEFEKGRQAHRNERKIEAGLGNFLGGLGAGAIGGIVFLFFVLLCLFSMAGDAIDSLDQSDEIAAEKAYIEWGCTQDKIEQWIIETNLIDELSLCENYNEYCQIWHNDYEAKGNNIWVITGITVKQDYSFKSTQFVLHSADAGDNWEIKWRSDENEEIRYGLAAIKIVNQNKITIRLSGTTSSSKLCTYDGGWTWRVENK